ncbi:MAG: hypothetical protein IPJ71_18350 [Bdellovibrionales bacterium]|nr:hypothetical protein [Bdellovibrionales bacterium]
MNDPIQWIRKIDQSRAILMAKYILLITILIALLGNLYFFNLPDIDKLSNAERSQQKRPELAVNGHILIQSFQTTDTESAVIKTPTRQLASEKRRLVKTRSSSSRKNDSSEQSNILVNDASYIWLKTLSARKTAQYSEKSEAADGYEILVSPVPRNTFGIFDSNALYVVIDGPGYEKKIVTGAFILKMESTDNVDSLARSHNLSVSYKATHIGVAILQAQDGQNLFEIESALKASPAIISVEIEILGKGARVK